MKIIKKMACAFVALAASQVWASEGNYYEFEVNGITFTSVNRSDETDFEAFKSIHNNFKNVPAIDNIFSNQCLRQKNGNPFHLRVGRNAKKEIIAAFVYGRVPTDTSKYVDPEKDYTHIFNFFKELSIINEDGSRKDNNGLATCLLMLDRDKINVMGDDTLITQLYTSIYTHAVELAKAGCKLPIEGTDPTHLAIIVRPNDPDNESMRQAGFSLTYDREVAEAVNADSKYQDENISAVEKYKEFSKSWWYEGYPTNVWTITLTSSLNPATKG